MIKTAAIVCALTMLLALSGSALADAPADAPDTPKIVQIGIILSVLENLNLGAGTYSAEFNLSCKCAEGVESCGFDPDFLNGRDVTVQTTWQEGEHTVYRVKGEFADKIDLAEFPFDQHDLQIRFADKQATISELVFEVDYAATGLEELVTLPGWDLLEDRIDVSLLDEQYSQVTFTLPIRRVRTGSVLKILVPVFFIILVSLLALLIRPISSYMRISLGTGTLLAAVMFHLSATSAIPPVGYVTLADKFMISTYLVLVVTLISSVLIFTANERKADRTAEIIYKAARFGVPILTLVVYYLVLRRAL